jgi:hypothetical protein
MAAPQAPAIAPAMCKAPAMQAPAHAMQAPAHAMQAPAHAMQAPAHAMATSQWRVPWRLLQSTCHGTCHASTGTCHASASTRHAHKPLACAMACAAEHTPQCLPWSAAHATKKHTPAIKRVPKRVPKRLRECSLNSEQPFSSLVVSIVSSPSLLS